jgi:hypothetical protein
MQTGTEDDLRLHAWSVLQSLVGTGDIADWDDRSGKPPWKNKCDLGLLGNSWICSYASGVDATAAHFIPHYKSGSHSWSGVETAVQLRPTQPPTSKVAPKDTASSSELASVFYNPAAANFISTNSLNNEAALEQFSTGSTAFPTNAVIIKLIWGFASVAPGANPSGPGTLLKIVNPPDFQHPDQFNFANPGSKPSSGLPLPSDSNPNWVSIQLDTDETHGCVVANVANGDSIPVNCFYHHPFQCEQIVANNAGEVPTTLRSCVPGQQVTAYLLGVHIITAEQRNWFWSTFWWSPQPLDDWAHHDQPAAVASLGPWGHYDMLATASQPQVNAGTVSDIAYNPYLEGLRENGLTSNCMYCHQIAGYQRGDHGNPSVANNSTLGSPSPCAYGGPPGPCPDTPFTAPSGAYMTRFLWTLANAQDPNIVKNGQTAGGPQIAVAASRSRRTRSRVVYRLILP